ncbi:hypothetical protein AB9C65_10825 [Klebsiella pasteurii]|uniref:Type VI secretion protein n=1 Tax=Klebsiella pasteurii TaxID=2587529 RepID=A0ABD5H9C1_9ENTR|nr:hypothetical protein [Klebsiella pasteurii]MDW2714466.1 hypothetical protein [Klebsiella pasteurii]
MPVNLKQIPPPAARPAFPKWWVWLLLLLGGLLAGTAWAILVNKETSEINAAEFWEIALVFPALFWLILLMLRIAWYKGLQATADGSNKEREQIIQREIRRGRRSLAVLGVSLRSALREPDDLDGQMQWNALQEKTQALKTQASWQSNEGIRHSRLIRIGNETAEQLLSRELSGMLKELSHVLTSVPADVPLALLVENNSSLSDSQIQSIWQQSWTASHIQQSVMRIEGRGLEVVDQWLDHHMNEPSMLLVAALQLAPEQVEGTAEAVVGLLLGSGTQIAADLTPLATLHRPEQAQGISNQDFNYALERAFDWVPIPAKAVPGGWLVGVDMMWNQTIATGLIALSSPINTGQNLHNLDSSLGYPGPAAPWLAIACATGKSSGGEPQLIVSGDGLADTPLWVTMVTPASELQG